MNERCLSMTQSCKAWSRIGQNLRYLLSLFKASEMSLWQLKIGKSWGWLWASHVSVPPHIFRLCCRPCKLERDQEWNLRHSTLFLFNFIFICIIVFCVAGNTRQTLAWEVISAALLDRTAARTLGGHTGPKDAGRRKQWKKWKKDVSREHVCLVSCTACDSWYVCINIHII